MKSLTAVLSFQAANLINTSSESLGINPAFIYC